MISEVLAVLYEAGLSGGRSELPSVVDTRNCVVLFEHICEAAATHRSPRR